MIQVKEEPAAGDTDEEENKEEQERKETESRQLNDWHRPIVHGRNIDIEEMEMNEDKKKGKQKKQDCCPPAVGKRTIVDVKWVAEHRAAMAKKKAKLTHPETHVACLFVLRMWG